MKVTLKSARVKCGLNLQDAALKIGVSRKTLQSWENYKSYPTIAQLPKIETAYHIKYDDIIFFTVWIHLKCNGETRVKFLLTDIKLERQKSQNAERGKK